MPVDDTRVTQRGNGLWSATEPFSLLGARFGRRMVIVSRNGVSALFSPHQSSRRILDESLGREFKVDFLIAPTGHHDTFFTDAAKEFPDAKRLTSGAFPRGVIDSVPLVDGFPREWDGVILPFLLDGMPRAQETVFYDRENETLIVSDFLFFFDENWGGWSRLMFRLAGMYGRPKMSRYFQFLVRDRGAFKRSLESLLPLKISHIIPSHGKVISENASGILQEAYDSLD